MKVSGAQRKENIIKNIEYVIRSRGETKASFSARTGVTRASLYKILEGKINSVQHSTVSRIASSLGVTCDIIENCDLEHIEIIDKTLSPDGDKNPAAVPVIPQSDFMHCLNMKVGFLTTQYPLTWFFGDESNVIALQVQNSISDTFYSGDIILIKRRKYPEWKQTALLYSEVAGLHCRINKDSDNDVTSADAKLIGTIIEERV